MTLVQIVSQSEKWRDWAKKQERCLRDYTRPNPEGEDDFRRLATEFRAFCDPSGLILDVGCRIEPRPHTPLPKQGAATLASILSKVARNG